MRSFRYPFHWLVDTITKLESKIILPFHNFTEQLLPYTVTDPHSWWHFVLLKIFFHNLHMMHKSPKHEHFHYYGSSRHGLIRKTPQRYHESNILLLFSPYWARCERPCKEKRTAALSVVRSWYGSAESPEGGIGRVCYKWCLQAWSCQSISSQLTCLMMSTRYFFNGLVGKDLPRKSWKWTCGLSPVTSTNLSSNKTHFLHSVSNACGLNLSSVQKLWSVFTKARPWGKELKDI